MYKEVKSIVNLKRNWYIPTLSTVRANKTVTSSFIYHASFMRCTCMNSTLNCYLIGIKEMPIE